VLKETRQFSLLEMTLLTGRKNQIRVHLADRGHPIVGDRKYGMPEDGYKISSLLRSPKHLRQIGVFLTAFFLKNCLIDVS